MSQTIDSGTTERPRDDVVLEVRDIEVTYDMARGRSRVLDNISIDIMRGETLAILGESGSGKTMFGSTLMNAVKEPGAVSGEVIYHPKDGEPIDIITARDRQLSLLRWEEIALAYQGTGEAFNPTQNMRTHFRETLDSHDVDREQGMEKAEELLQTLNLDPDRVLDAHRHELSGGEKQRVMIALSLVFDPEVLILDEPTAALDVIMERNILSLLADIREEYDITLVLITHDIPIAAAFADRIALMYAFDIVELGQTDDVLLNPDHPYMRLMSQSALDLEMPLDQVATIDGDTPDPINVPSGCSFHPVCPIADDRCEVEEPELRAEDGSDHEVACFYPDLASERIPLSLSEEEGESR